MADASPTWVAYADGSCLGNPGRGGWGVLVIDPDGNTHEYSGADPATTNNRMEITAAIEALRSLPSGAEVKLHSDSQYVVKTMTLGWKRRENLDLWRLLDHEAIRRRVRWEWVRGHNGDPLNERVDELARSAAEGRAARNAPASRASQKAAPTVAMRLASLLRPGEEVRQCAACGKDFVAIEKERFCSHVICQLRARSAER
ncbi:MAG TPA: ribonuclease H [Candidatus Binataceae bacterium]|nr:ribonuclease H [Candidatus Binataceae bacterium]